jgi:RNA polymerase sigma-70 factor (ECF subfamily)
LIETAIRRYHWQRSLSTDQDFACDGPEPQTPPANRVPRNRHRFPEFGAPHPSREHGTGTRLTLYEGGNPRHDQDHEPGRGTARDRSLSPAAKDSSGRAGLMSRSERKERFERLVRTWGEDLFRYAVWLCGNEALARDLVQETCLRAWKALDSLKQEGAAKSWLITILRREYARTFERKVPPLTDIDSVVVTDDEELGPEERSERALLARGMASLPRKYREPLLLQVVMGHSCAEIAEQLGITRSAVMTQLFRAREQLKEQLQQDGLTGNVHELQ